MSVSAAADEYLAVATHLATISQRQHGYHNMPTIAADIGPSLLCCEVRRPSAFQSEKEKIIEMTSLNSKT